MTIKQLCYELYKEDWKFNHIYTTDILGSYVDYYNYLKECEMSSGEYSYDDYIFEYGYNNGEIYACFDEFLENEYLETEYIEELLNDDKVFELYLKDIKED